MSQVRAVAAPPPTFSVPSSSAIDRSDVGPLLRGVAHALPVCLVFWTLVVLCVLALG